MTTTAPAPYRRLLLVLVALAALGARPAAADLDVAFVIDTTGSMGGELHEAQQRLREPRRGARYQSQRRAPALRCRRLPRPRRRLRHPEAALTAEVGVTDAFLAGLSAAGGGDGPESVMAGLMAALRDMDWDDAATGEHRIVLVGDAPAHLDYLDEPSPEAVIAEARRDRVVIDTIGCRSLPPEGVALFRRLAYATEGAYQHIGRVELPTAGEPGRDRGLIAALGRAAGADGEAALGEELALAPLGHRAAASPVLLVRTLPAVATDEGSTPCALEVLLPPGLALAGEVEARRLPDRLRVRLALGEGNAEGGAERFALATCPPLALPIEVELAGGN